VDYTQQITSDRSLRENVREKSLRAALLTGTAGFADFGIRIASTAVLARLLLPEHFGLIMMVMAVTLIADQLREMGLSTAAVQCKELTHAKASNVFWVSVAIGAGMAGLLCAASPLIAGFYNEPRLISITCILAANFLMGGLMVQHQVLLTRQLKLGHTAGVRLSSSLISTVAAIGLAWLEFGYWALVWREVIRCALTTAGMWICCPWKPSLPQRHVTVRDLVRFGADVTGANLLASFSASADRFLLGRLWGAAPVAVYRQAYQLLLVPMDQLLSPLFQVSQPVLSLLQTDAHRYRQFFRKLLMAVCLVTMPASVFIAVYSTEITLLLLGPRWLECAPLLLILSFATFIRQPVSFSALLLITRGRSRAYLFLTVAQHTLLLALLCLGVWWGPRGVAIGEVAATYALIAPTLYICLAGSPVSLKDALTILSRMAAMSAVAGAGLLVYRMVEPSAPLVVTLALGGILTAALFIGSWLALPGGAREVVDLLRDLQTALGKKLPLFGSRANGDVSTEKVTPTVRAPEPISPKS
jgi:O-antigen/teichoic acid export membrane protein